jgi:glyoxylase-like metal-dependent hydrolase (beta-lactamase superfamily II)
MQADFAYTHAMSDGLYFRQLLAGRDFAKRDPIAASMVNFVYLIGDRAKRECVVVDPAWDAKGILDIVDADGMKLVGALGTHYHPDHVGGSMMGFTVPGMMELNALRPVKLHVNEHEAEGIKKVTGLSESDIVRHAGGDTLSVGDVEIRFIHTPGHTPGSQCFLVDGRLVSGDTLFVQGCGRVDLPGADPAQMYESLTQRLAKLPEQTILYPGHDYGHSPTSTIGAERRQNAYMRVPSLETWMAMMGA